MWRKPAALLCLLLAALPAPAGAGHGDIHARCDGDEARILERPPGTEEVMVICRGGAPDFLVQPPIVPYYQPAEHPLILPADFAGWVVVWINGLK
jgi:hypothetical protein